MDRIKKAILKTIAWFNLFDRPLNSTEIHQYLYGVKTDKAMVERGLGELKKKKALDKINYYYFLPGRKSIVAGYSKSRYYSRRKVVFVKNKIIPRLFPLPYLEFIGVTGSVAYRTAGRDPDIDLLAITCPNRLWTCRYFLLSNLDKNQLRVKSPNRICLNFLIASDALNLKKIFKKTYDRYWLATLLPIYGFGYGDLITANSWIRRSFPNLNFSQKIPHSPAPAKKRILESMLVGKIGDRFESFLKKEQMKIIRENTKKFGRDAAVKITKNMAKIHFISLANKYEPLYRKKLKEIGKVS